MWIYFIFVCVDLQIYLYLNKFSFIFQKSIFFQCIKNLSRWKFGNFVISLYDYKYTFETRLYYETDYFRNHLFLKYISVEKELHFFTYTIHKKLSFISLEKIPSVRNENFCLSPFVFHKHVSPKSLCTSSTFINVTHYRPGDIIWRHNSPKPSLSLLLSHLSLATLQTPFASN